MHILQIVILAMIQGLAELLPVSSSAHVIVAEKLMDLDPSSAEMTFLLVMLHTGTMFAVLFYFRKRWRARLSQPGSRGKTFIRGLVIATAVTGVVGLGLKKIIEETLLGDLPHAEIEALFSNLPMISGALAAVGVVIFFAGRQAEGRTSLGAANSAVIGAVQGLCLPFRGFSRSGATISIGLFVGIPRALAEEFSFALAVILTPPVVARELWRLIKAHELSGTGVTDLVMPGLLGMVFSFGAGLLALRWISNWIEKGKWTWFGYYCFFASGVVLLVSFLKP